MTNLNVQKRRIHDLFGLDDLTGLTPASQLVFAERKKFLYEGQGILFIQPANQQFYQQEEIILLQYFLEMNWVWLMDLEKGKIEQNKVPHFIIYQNDENVESLLIPNYQMIDGLTVQSPLLYADLVVFSIHCGFSVETMQVKDLQRRLDSQSQLSAFVTVVGNTFINCKLNSEKIDFIQQDQFVSFDKTFCQNLKSHGEKDAVFIDLESDSNSLQEQRKIDLYRARVKHVSIVSNFRIQDVLQTDQVLQIPIALSVVPMFHDKQYSNFEILEVQKFYKELCQDYQSMLINSFIEATDVQVANSTLIHQEQVKHKSFLVNENDCPFHFNTVLYKLELKLLQCFLSQFFINDVLRQIENQQQLKLSIKNQLKNCWISALNYIGIDEKFEMDEFLKFLLSSELVYSKEQSNPQPDLSLIISDQQNFKRMLDQSLLTQFPIFIDRADEQLSINDQVKDYLLIIFNKVMFCFQQSKCFNLLQNFKTICNQLAQLSFVCQNSTLIQTIDDSQSTNFFLSDSSRSGKSSVAQALFYHSLFQNLRNKQYPTCVTMIQNMMQFDQQPLYKHYSIKIKEENLQFFRFGRAVFEQYYSLRESNMTLYQKLQQFVCFCFQLSISNQLDHLFSTILLQQIGEQANKQLIKHLSFVSDYANFEEHLADLNAQLQVEKNELQIQKLNFRIQTFVQLQVAIQFMQNSFCYDTGFYFKQQQLKDVVLLKSGYNMFEFIEKAKISKQIEYTSENIFCLNQNSDEFLLCFDEFLSIFHGRIQDSPVIMSFIPMLKLFFQLTKEQQNSLVTSARQNLLNSNLVEQPFSDICKCYIQETKLLIPKELTENPSVIKQLLFSSLYIQTNKFRKCSLINQFLRQIAEANDDVLDIYFQNIFNDNDIIKLLLSGGPNISFLISQADIYNRIYYSCQSTSILKQQDNNLISDSLFDVFSFRGAALIQVRQIKAVINKFIRCGQNENVAIFGQNLSMSNLNSFVVLAVLRFASNSESINILTKTVDKISSIIKYNQNSVFNDQGVFKILQINTDISAINYSSLIQLMTIGSSSRAVFASTQSNIEYSQENKPVMLQKLVSVPASYFKQYAQGMDIIQYQTALLEIVFQKSRINSQRLAKSYHSGIVEMALMLQDTINIFQQIFSDLNPYIIIVEKMFRKQVQKKGRYTDEDTLIISTMPKTLFYGDSFVINRFTPFLFHSSLQIKIDVNYLDATKTAGNDFLNNGFLKCQIFQQNQDQYIFDGYIDSVHTFSDIYQFQEKLNFFIPQKEKLVLVRVMEASNYNLVLQQLIQSSFNLQVKTEQLETSTFLISVAKENRNIFVVDSTYQTVSNQFDYFKKLFCDFVQQHGLVMKQKQLVAPSLNELKLNLKNSKIQLFCIFKDLEQQNNDKNRIGVQFDFIGRLYTLLELVHNMVSIDTLLEFFLVQLLKFIFSNSSDDQMSVSALQTIRDLTILVRIFCIFKQNEKEQLEFIQKLKQQQVDSQASQIVDVQKGNVQLSFNQKHNFRFAQQFMKLPNYNFDTHSYTDDIIFYDTNALLIDNQDQLAQFDFNRNLMSISKQMESKKQEIKQLEIKPTGGQYFVFQKAPQKLNAKRPKESKLLTNFEERKNDTLQVVENQFKTANVKTQQLQSKDSLLTLFENLVDYKNVHFGQLSLSQDGEQYPVNDGSTVSQTSGFKHTDSHKRQQLFALIDKAINYSQSYAQNRNKVFIFYAKLEVGAFDNTNLVTEITIHGDGVLIAVGLDQLMCDDQDLDLSSEQTGQMHRSLKELTQNMTLVKRNAIKTWLVGVEFGRHNLKEIYQKFYFGEELVLNVIQLGIDITDNTQPVQDSIENGCFAHFLNQSVDFDSLVNTVISGAKDFQFFQDLLQRISYHFPDLKFRFDTNAFFCPPVAYLFQKYYNPVGYNQKPIQFKNTNMHLKLVLFIVVCFLVLLVSVFAVIFHQ